MQKLERLKSIENATKRRASKIQLSVHKGHLESCGYRERGCIVKHAENLVHDGQVESPIQSI